MRRRQTERRVDGRRVRCHPGFTEDVSRANGTGHVPLDVSFSSFPSLYADVDPTIIDAFVRSLRPYACVVRAPPGLQTRPRRVSVRAMSSEHGHAHRSRPSSRGGSNHPERCVTSRVPRKRQRVGVSMRRRRRRPVRSRRRRGDARRVHPARRAIPETSPPSLSIQVVGARTRVRYTSSRVHHRSRASAASAARAARAAIEVQRADRARTGTPSSRNLVAWTRLYGVRSVGLHT